MDRTPSIADAVVVKHDDLFLVCRRDGGIPFAKNHGFGLYFHDCRFVNGYELRIAGTAAVPLSATSAHGYMATLELANAAFRIDDSLLVDKDRVAITWTRVLDGERCTLHDRIALTSYASTRVVLPVTIALRAAFEDIFTVRGRRRTKSGKLHAPVWRHNTVEITYDGIDGVRRFTRAQFNPAPDAKAQGTATFRVSLEPHECATISVAITVGEGDARSTRNVAGHVDGVIDRLERASKRWLQGHAEVDCDNPLINRLVERSVCDLQMLRTRIDGKHFVAAGIPWFVAFFGRDSAVTALESLAFDHRIAGEALHLLATYQGTTVDDWRDEQPGKIHHELRVGELTRAQRVPYSPYYGSVDATPLFLILLGRHAAWTADLDLFRRLLPHVEGALDWIAQNCDRDHDGYLVYDRSSPDGLTNQGWKDSGDAINNTDGSLAEPPLALAEVQGYVFLAKQLIADLFRRCGDGRRAAALEGEAAALQARFNKDFWMPGERCYALALQRGGKPAAVVSSNAGQVLWTGIAETHKATRTAERLLRGDMFSGWGVRTLSTRERRYNPIGYHIGTVWPHDNALIAAGCRRYGLDAAAARIANGIMAAGMSFEHYRLPELFAGLPRNELETPVRYPVANHPQAWGAGSVLYLMETMLGLVPEAFEGRLRIVHPMLPDDVHLLDVRRLRVGRGEIDLRFRRVDNAVSVDVVKVSGAIDVVVELAETQSGV